MSRGSQRRSSTLGNIGAVGVTRISFLSPAQVSTLIAALARGLLWGRRATSCELAAWFQLAEAIPDDPIREDALDSLARKRDNVEGASLFSILPKHRNECLLVLLVAYQVMWDFLDSVSERGASVGHANGRQLHRALVEALDPDAPVSDYYRYHPWKNDGGYLLALVETCRRMCIELPSYRQVRHLMLDGVERCAIQYLNHDPEPRRRDAALREWAERESVDEHRLDWFELTAAAGAFMPHVLLALAAEPSCEPQELIAVHSAYFPWISLAIAMLDSYVDLRHDVATESHSYISHYASETVALDRLAAVIRRIVTHAARLPNGRRHVVLTEGIVAMYLSTPGVKAPSIREKTRALTDASGHLTKLLLAIAYMWRATRAGEVGSDSASNGLPPGMPIPTTILTYMYWRWPLSCMEQCQARYGKRFTHRMTSFPRLVFLSDPTEVKAMLGAPADVLHPGEGGMRVAPIVGQRSFMLLDGPEHLDGRRAVLPALQKRMIDTESHWVIDTVRRTIGLWPRDTPLPLHPRLRALTLKVIMRRIFADGEPQCEDRLSALLDTVLAMLAATGSVVFPVPILRHGPGRTVWRRFLRHRSEVDTLIHALIDERLHAGWAGRDALAVLLGARNADGTPMTRPQLRDNVMSLILAGHETTASQLAWAFQLLAHNPAVQRRLIEEIDEDSGDTYLTATIQEVLRHRPVFLFTIPRAVVQPIEIGGWTYEPPAHLLGCIYLVHHDPDVYPEPNEFRPERFLEGQPSPHAYLPWGGGRRRCPGSHLALLEMKTVLRAVLETMTVSPASRRMERPRWRSVIVTPHAGSRVVLSSRERRSVTVRRPRRTAVGACPAPIHTADLLEHGP
jgi:cytochrome P450